MGCCFQQKTCNISETGQDRTNVTRPYWWPIGSRIRTFDWCQNQRPRMTLKGYYALCFKTRASFGAHHEKLKLNVDRPILSATLECGNIRFTQIFAGFPGGGDVKQRGFSCFRTLRFRHLRKWGQHYYIVLFSSLSPFHWPQNTWPWMAILRSIFTITKSVSAIRLHIYRMMRHSIYRIFLLYDVTNRVVRKGTVKRWSTEYYGSAKGFRIFRSWNVAGAIHRRNVNK